MYTNGFTGQKYLSVIAVKHFDGTTADVLMHDEFMLNCEQVYMAADGSVAINPDGSVNLVAHIDNGAQS